MRPLSLGMNLVGHEYVISHGISIPNDARSVPGALILSEFAGSANSLNGAFIVNPWNTEEVAAAFNQALRLTDVYQVILG